jgi:hypothetical protein
VVVVALEVIAQVLSEKTLVVAPLQNLSCQLDLGFLIQLASELAELAQPLTTLKEPSAQAQHFQALLPQEGEGLVQHF